MKIYRYEKSDGGGPFVNPKGIVRGTEFKVNSLAPGAIYGCESVDKLEEYFSNQTGLDMSGCIIKEYLVPEENIIHKSNKEIIFIP